MKRTANLKVIKGSLLEIQEGTIIHQVNCKGVMEAGIAKQIALQFPSHLQDYKTAYMDNKLKLGSIVHTVINPRFHIIGVAGQMRQYTDYKALIDSLSTVAVLSEHKAIPSPIYLPYKIGCKLGGGDWKEIHNIIYDTLPKAIIVTYFPNK